jgi:hypothetical protein
MRQALKAALVAVTIIAPVREALSATITVHAPDGDDRVFVDVVGQINVEDFKIFKEKTDQIYPIGAGHPNKQVIVTLVSYGGRADAALQIGDWIRKRGMSTFVLAPWASRSRPQPRDARPATWVPQPSPPHHLARLACPRA